MTTACRLLGQRSASHFAKDGDKIKPQLLFHAGRLCAFFLLGGVIGMLGASFDLGPGSMFFMNTAVGVIMLLLGINLLDVLPSLKRFQPALPAGVSRCVHRVSVVPSVVSTAWFRISPE